MGSAGFSEEYMGSSVQCTILEVYAARRMDMSLDPPASSPVLAISICVVVGKFALKIDSYAKVSYGTVVNASKEEI